MRVPPARGVALGRDQRVRAHRVQPVAAERAGVRGRLAVLRAADRPPVGPLEASHGLGRRRRLRLVRAAA